MTKYKVMIYDYDRAYVKRLGNNESLSDDFCKLGLCNKLIDNLDIFKISCYLSKVIRSGQPLIARALYLLISPKPDQLFELYKTYPDCLYDTEGLEDKIESLLYSAPKIIENIYKNINTQEFSLTSDFKKNVENVYCINKNNFLNGQLKEAAQKEAIDDAIHLMYTTIPTKKEDMKMEMDDYEEDGNKFVKKIVKTSKRNKGKKTSKRNEAKDTKTKVYVKKTSQQNKKKVKKTSQQNKDKRSRKGRTTIQ